MFEELFGKVVEENKVNKAAELFSAPVKANPFNIETAKAQQAEKEREQNEYFEMAEDEPM